MTKFKNPVVPMVYSVTPAQLGQLDKDLKDLKSVLADLINNLNVILDAGIDFDDNVDCVFVTYTTNAIANTQDTVAHGLGKIPVGYIVVNRDKVGIVYKSSTFTDSNLFLKCNVASTAVTLLVF